MPSTSFISSLTGAFAFSVVNLGCKVNRVESDTITAVLASLGAQSVKQEDADVIVVNTCTVTGEADKKTRKAVRHALSVAPKATVIVTGCAVAIDAQAYLALSDRVKVVQRVDLLEELSNLAKDPLLRFGEEYRTRVSLKVQDGCNRACTYCIVHVARGPAWSVSFEQVCEEAERYMRAGAKELVLTGIDLGSYSDGGRTLSDLVNSLLEFSEKTAKPGEPPTRLRASSLEPHSVDSSFIELLAQSDGRLCRHLHLPLQAGSTRVLREMARPYTAKHYREIIDELYERVPSLSLTTDIICGFPGETEEDFQKTLELARHCRFSKIHVFPYSMRAGTPAAERSDQVAPEIKAKRCAQLRELSDELRRIDLETRRGKAELCLVESDVALTESYHEIAAPEGAVPGSLVEVLL